MSCSLYIYEDFTTVVCNQLVMLLLPALKNEPGLQLFAVSCNKPAMSVSLCQFESKWGQNYMQCFYHVRVVDLCRRDE